MRLQFSIMQVIFLTGIMDAEELGSLKSTVTKCWTISVPHFVFYTHQCATSTCRLCLSRMGEKKTEDLSLCAKFKSGCGDAGVCMVVWAGHDSSIMRIFLQFEFDDATL